LSGSRANGTEDVSAHSQNKAERLIWVAVAVLVLLCLRYTRLYGGNVVDDAMTSMQYAKQLALGNGLVFNTGERVEGYTNFAWVIFMTPLYWLSTQLGFHFVSAVTLFNIGFASANLVLVWALARRFLGERHPAPWLAVGLCLADNSFAVWAILGLEVHFLALFMLLAVWASTSASPRRYGWLGLALLGAHLTRPDAGLFCAVMVAYQALDAALVWRSGDRGEAARRAVGVCTAAGVWLVLYGAYFYARYRYYGMLFPNTFYVKLGGPIDAWARGLRYLHGFLAERAYTPLLALLAALWVRHPLVRVLLVYNSLHALYVVYVGGDFFAGHRFFVPELPQLALLVALGVAAVAERAQRASWFGAFRQRYLPGQRAHTALLVAAVALLALVFQRGVTRGPLVGEVRRWGRDLTNQTRLFRWLGEHRPPAASVATCLIGHTGFYSSARVIDMCGIIDPETARREVKNFGKGKAGHEKRASGEETLRKRPTFVVAYAIPGDLYRHGYFLRADIPEDTYEGIWQLDPLLAEGSLLPSTRVDFDRGRPEGWHASGDAFQHWPSRRRFEGQGELVGASGGFINTFHPKRGDSATGRLESAPFELVGDLLVFRLGGGKDAKRLRVELLVDGAVKYTTTGRRGDQLSRRQWDIRALRGKRAVLRVVDESTERWGHLSLDELVQWQK
jgi:arabinofuranosyltransferase